MILPIEKRKLPQSINNKTEAIAFLDWCLLTFGTGFNPDEGFDFSERLPSYIEKKLEALLLKCDDFDKGLWSYYDPEVFLRPAMKDLYQNDIDITSLQGVEMEHLAVQDEIVIEASEADDPESTYWTVFGHLESGVRIYLIDFDKEEEAEEFRSRLQNVINLIIPDGLL